MNKRVFSKVLKTRLRGPNYDFKTFVQEDFDFGYPSDSFFGWEGEKVDGKKT